MLMGLLEKVATPQEWDQMGVRVPSLSLHILFHPCQDADLPQGSGKQACHSRSPVDKDILGSQREGLWVLKAAAALFSC